MICIIDKLSNEIMIWLKKHNWKLNMIWIIDKFVNHKILQFEFVKRKCKNDDFSKCSIFEFKRKNKKSWKMNWKLTKLIMSFEKW